MLYFVFGMLYLVFAMLYMVFGMAYLAYNQVFLISTQAPAIKSPKNILADEIQKQVSSRSILDQP